MKIFYLKNKKTGRFIGFGVGRNLWAWAEEVDAVLWPGVYDQQSARDWAAKQGTELTEEKPQWAT